MGCFYHILNLNPSLSKKAALHIFSGDIPYIHNIDYIVTIKKIFYV